METKINLVLQRSLLDGFVGVLAVTLVDYFYICLSIFGVGVLLENKKTKKIFGVVSSLILIIFGVVIIKNLIIGGSVTSDVDSVSLFSSFVFVFLLTISSPMTIVFFTSLFTAKAIEYNYKKKQLLFFGLGTGLATLLFMGSSVIVFSLVKDAVPMLLVEILNALVGGLLIAYGAIRFRKNLIHN